MMFQRITRYVKIKRNAVLLAVTFTLLVLYVAVFIMFETNTPFDKFNILFTGAMQFIIAVIIFPVVAKLSPFRISKIFHYCFMGVAVLFFLYSSYDFWTIVYKSGSLDFLGSNLIAAFVGLGMFVGNYVCIKES